MDGWMDGWMVGWLDRWMYRHAEVKELMQENGVRKTEGEQIKEYRLTEARKGKSDKEAGLVNNVKCNVTFKEDED